MTNETSLDGTRVVVTGGAGFIGSHLVDALVARGARVVVLDNLETGRLENLAASRDRIELVVADVRESEACRRVCRGAKVVFHQAALGSVPRSMDDPAATVEVNVAGTARLFSAAREEGVPRIVYASSSAVYGDSVRSPKREGEEGCALSPYAVSKAMNEELAAVFARCFGMTFLGLRYFNVYGPRQRPDGPYAAVVPRFVEAARRGDSPEIQGDGRQSRDFTFVEDVVEANLRAARAPVDGAVALNVGGGASVTIESLARVVAQLAGRPPRVRRSPPRPGDVRHSRADPQRALEVLGFRPRTSLEEGLARTLAHDGSMSRAPGGVA